MIDNIGLVLEGGGSKGAFTIGVLEFLMEKEIYTPYVIGVSAGAMNAINYVSRQRGRARESTIDLVNGKMIGLTNFFDQQSIFDLEFIFNAIPNEIVPFDYDTFFASNTRCVITVTNCETGKAEFLEEKEDKKKLFTMLRASTALPFLAPIVDIDGGSYLDGGISDSIPIKEAIKQGYKKNIIVLTKPKGYRKEQSSFEKNMSILFYNKYPNLVKAIVSRYKRYNKEMEYIEKLEEEGKVLVIRPEEKYILSRTEKKYEPLMRLCNHGYSVTSKMYEEIIEFIG